MVSVILSAQTDRFMVVIPAKAGIHLILEFLDSRLRGNDGLRYLLAKTSVTLIPDSKPVSLS